MNTFCTAKGTELPILNLRGKDYLEVKYRLVWFREEHPDWSIETRFVTITEQFATAKAIIKNAEGRVIATAHKSEDKKGFFDFAEKAETGAIGRALALIGYGTQFCADELDEGDRIVDAPAARVGTISKVVYPDHQEENGCKVAQAGRPYIIPFGQNITGRTIDEALRVVGPEKLRDAVEKTEAKLAKGEIYKNSTPEGMQEFIDRVSAVIIALENGEIES